MTDAWFKDQVVAVTGASSGIGEAVAYRLAAQGARLALAARSVERLNGVAVECERRGGKAVAVPTDVSDEAECKRLLERTVETYGRIDMLVNNAGFSVRAALADLPDLAAFKEVIAVNFMGSVHCTYHALPYLKDSRGRIVAVSSVSAVVPSPMNAAYAASKQAMAGFFDSLRIELADSGVTVTVIYPDFVVTGLVANTRRASGERMGEDAARRFYKSTMMTADECAAIIVKAAAERRREVTTSRRGKLARWIKLLAPGRMDRMAKRIFRA